MRNKRQNFGKIAMYNRLNMSSPDRTYNINVPRANKFIVIDSNSVNVANRAKGTFTVSALSNINTISLIRASFVIRMPDEENDTFDTPESVAIPQGFWLNIDIPNIRLQQNIYTFLGDGQTPRRTFYIKTNKTVVFGVRNETLDIYNRYIEYIARYREHEIQYCFAEGMPTIHNFDTINYEFIHVNPIVKAATLFNSSRFVSWRLEFKCLPS